MTNNNGHSPFSPAERDGVFKAIYNRRDIRSYLPKAVPEDLLLKLLEAAHHAPSVGFMQPWNFIVIRDLDLRKKVYSHFRAVNEKAATNYKDDQNLAYRSLKLQGILDSPLNILVTCDTKRGGEHVLGRATIPETDLYSTCLAIENFWLAARAEEVGVGWMSLHEPAKVAQIFSVPADVIPVAYLTVGYPVEFPEEPLLQSVGWSKRLNLKDVIFYDCWGKIQDNADVINNMENSASSGNPAKEQTGVKEDEDNQVTPNPETVLRMENLTKPRKSLGYLEDIALKLSAIQKKPYPEICHKHLLLMAGDHGISSEGVSAYKKELTTRMVYQFVAGTGAVNAIARQNRIHLHIADLGVDHDFNKATGIIHEKIRRGSRNFLYEPAMTLEETQAALQAGKNIVKRLPPADVLALGEMGIGNSSAAAAIVSVLTGVSVAEAVGSGTGVGPQTREKKVSVLQKALDKHADKDKDPQTVLATFGGYEIAGLAGAILEASQRRIPVLLDGYITGAAALVAAKMDPGVCQVLFAAHRSREPGHGRVLAELGLIPILDLGMALGEGSGAALAVNILETAVKIFREMRTFEEAGIDDPMESGALM